jgi:1-acyl-sn-glycerol-3-phosphate acyltransferase
MRGHCVRGNGAGVCGNGASVRGGKRESLGECDQSINTSGGVMQNETRKKVTSAIFGIIKPAVACFTKRKVLGAEKLEKYQNTPLLVVSTHMSNLDSVFPPTLLSEYGIYAKVFAKDTLWKNPILKPLLNVTNMIPVKRNSKDAANSLDIAKSVLDNNECILIYPEGTTTKDPDYWPMSGKTGAARLAFQNDVTVLPIAQDGAQNVFNIKNRKNSKSLLGGHLLSRQTITMSVGEPIELDDLKSKYLLESDLDAKKLVLKEATDKIMQTLASMVGDMRNTSPPAELYDYNLGKRV